MRQVEMYNVRGLNCNRSIPLRDAHDAVRRADTEYPRRKLDVEKTLLVAETVWCTRHVVQRLPPYLLTRHVQTKLGSWQSIKSNYCAAITYMYGLQLHNRLGCIARDIYGLPIDPKYTRWFVRTSLTDFSIIPLYVAGSSGLSSSRVLE